MSSSTSTPHRQLVLVGAGPSHLHLLRSLAQLPVPLLDVTLVSPHPNVLPPDLLANYLAGHVLLGESQIDLRALARAASARYLPTACVGLDTRHLMLTLADGQTLPYHFLSLDTGGMVYRDSIETAMPGARKNAMFVQPLEALSNLWPRFTDVAAGRPMRVSVVAKGLRGLELAMAVQHRLPLCRVTLVAGVARHPLAQLPDKLRRRVERALEHFNITVLRVPCTGVEADEILLGDGARLASDATLISADVQAPRWLTTSGLTLNEQGFVKVNEFQQSTSHGNVFAVGEVASRIDAPRGGPGVQDLAWAPVLDQNLRAALHNQPLKAHWPKPRPLLFVHCGDAYAVGAWRGWTFEGRWVWRWKHRIDSRYLRQFSLPAG